MADSIVSSLPAKTTPVSGDILYLVDSQTTTQNAAGSSASLTVGNLTTNYIAATLASATQTLTNKTFDTAGTGNVLKINGTQVSAITGTGSVVLATSPTLVTPTIGVATATSINKVAITTPASSATLTIANGKTLTVSNSLTFAGTDSTTMTFPSTTDTVVTLTATQTMTNKTLTKPTFTGSIQVITAMAAQAVNGSLGNIFTRTLAASETFTQSNFSTGQVFLVKVQQGSGTSYTVTWFSTITWITQGSSAPVQTTTSNGYTTYGFVCTGSNTFDGYLVGSQ